MNTKIGASVPIYHAPSGPAPSAADVQAAQRAALSGGSYIGGVTRFTGGRNGGLQLPGARQVASITVATPQLFTVFSRGTPLLTPIPGGPVGSDTTFQNVRPMLHITWGDGKGSCTMDVPVGKPVTLLASTINVIGYFGFIGGSRPGWTPVGGPNFNRFKCEMTCFIEPGRQPALATETVQAGDLLGRFKAPLSNTPAILRSVFGFNGTATDYYLHFFDWTILHSGEQYFGTTSPPDGFEPNFSFPVPAKQPFSLDDRDGFVLSTGLYFVASSTPFSLTAAPLASFRVHAQFAKSVLTTEESAL